MDKSKNKYGYNTEEIKLFKKLNSPAKIQDYLNFLRFNIDKNGGDCMSPRFVIQNQIAHCAEGAIFAAAVLEFNGLPPLILDLRSTEKPFDYDHVIAVFKVDGFFGAISKTNHCVLRYREPIYKSIRELVMSYFHEYFLNTGEKTLREYSDPLNLTYFDKLIGDRWQATERERGSTEHSSANVEVLSTPVRTWRTTDKNISDILDFLDDIKHYKILTPKQIKNLRKADKIEIEAGKLTATAESEQ